MPITVLKVDLSKNGPVGCQVSLPPILSQSTSFTQKAPAGHGDRGDNAHRLLLLLIFLMLQFPELGWVDTSRKSGQGRKTRWDLYPSPRWRGPTCRAALLSLNRTCSLIAVPSLALPSHPTVLAGPLLSQASRARSMPPTPGQYIPPRPNW